MSNASTASTNRTGDVAEIPKCFSARERADTELLWSDLERFGEVLGC